jgi:hypothetical protein
MKIGNAERLLAKLHATAHESAAHQLMDQAGRRSDIDQKTMYTLAVATLTLGGEYRRIANSGEIAE